MEFNKNWFLPIKTVAAEKPHLICFPYGGGGTAAFWRWKELSCDINIWAVKLPGREGRIGDAPITPSLALVREIISQLSIRQDDQYLFYGHSMGAGLAFQAMIEMEKNNIQLPSHLIASGRRSPHIPSVNVAQGMSDNELLTYLQSLGGIPADAKFNQAFLQQYIPKIRSDYYLHSTIPAVSPQPLPVKISLINGRHDKLVSENDLLQWADYSTYPVRSRLLDGGHFFMDEAFDKFLNEIKEVIND